MPLFVYRRIIVQILTVCAAICLANAFVVGPATTPAVSTSTHRSQPSSSAVRFLLPRHSTTPFWPSGRTSVRSRTTVSGAAPPALSASSPRSIPTVNESRRKELLTRRGNHFQLDRSSGRIEFGSTAYLVTQLTNPNEDEDDNSGLISTWLRDEKGLAMSIWDEKLVEDRGNSVYRLQVMPLRFVTLQVAPWVEVEMKTLLSKTNQQPVFCLQSIDFDPNIQILPGMRVTAESFGIVIEVAGQLRPSADGKGVQGAIAFQTTGQLSRPLRLVPESALKAAADTINDTVVKFATESFQKGARAQYQRFLQQQQPSQRLS